MSDKPSRLDDMEGALPGAPFFVPDAYDQILANLDAKIRRERAKKWAEKLRTAKPPSEKIENYLSYLLGGDHLGVYGIEQFVRFANGYFSGTLTMVHYVQAVKLAKDGYNWYGNVQSLMDKMGDA